MENTRYKILLIEDDTLDQMAFERLVEEENLPYDCTIAGSVSKANSILSADKFDIVIADYLLGDGTAFDILDSIKDASIIITTGAGDEEIAIRAMKAGACDYIIKDPERNYLKALPVTVNNVIKHKKVEEKLKEYDQLKSKLVMTVSHELKTSLCTFKRIISDAMAGVLGPLNNKLRKQLEIGDRTIDRLAKTISDFIDISKIETGRIQLRRTRVDMKQIVSEAIFLLADLAAEKKIKLSAAYPPDPHFTVYADHALVRQIFVNLIDNAIKFSPMGGAIHITVKDLKNEVQVNMQDTSIGIGNEDISKAFNSFIQSDEYAGPGPHGAGLGLYVAKQLIEVQSGQIWAESTPGQGSIFCFTLPKSDVQEVATPAAAKTEESACVSNGNEHD